MLDGEVRMLEYDLLREHGLTDWDFSVSDLTSPCGARLGGTGFCEHTSKLIMLDVVLLCNPKTAVDVLLHEIAHALLPADIEDHGLVWAAKALEIGVSEENVKTHCPTYFGEVTK